MRLGVTRPAYHLHRCPVCGEEDVLLGYRSRVTCVGSRLLDQGGTRAPAHKPVWMKLVPKEVV